MGQISCDSSPLPVLAVACLAPDRAVTQKVQPRPRLLTRILDLLLRRTAPLSSDQQDRLFRLFVGLHHAYPQLLPGVARIAGAD